MVAGIGGELRPTKTGAAPTALALIVGKKLIEARGKRLFKVIFVDSGRSLVIGQQE